MKQFIALLIFLFGVQLLAQSNKAIEKTLNEHYKKVQKNYYPYEITQKNYQSILDENDVFTAELIYYLKTHPETIENSFIGLVKKGFVVTTSPDSKFRIYSWAINLGGKDNFVYNIFQFRNKNKYSIWADKENNYEGSYVIDIFEAKLNGRQYYLPYVQSEAGGSTVMQSIMNFRDSEYGIVNEDKLFKTGEEAYSSISIYFDFFSVLDHEERPVRLIKFNAKTKTFTLPYVNPKDLKVSLTEKEYYKFSGKYFE